MLRLPLARTLPGQLIEVHCRVPVDVARARYRARTGRRHAGHLDEQRADQELWGQPCRPLGLGPVVEVDTSGPVNLAQVTAAITEALTAR